VPVMLLQELIPVAL